MEKRRNIQAGRKSSHSTSFIKQVVRELIEENISYGQAAKRHGLTKNMVSRWYKKYSADIAPLTISAHMNKEEYSELEQERARTQALQEALAQAQLKITALELTIEIAKQELGIDIGKKSGSQ